MKRRRQPAGHSLFLHHCNVVGKPISLLFNLCKKVGHCFLCLDSNVGCCVCWHFRVNVAVEGCDWLAESVPPLSEYQPADELRSEASLYLKPISVSPWVFVYPVL